MILFINPRATKPKNRRFPLSLMAVGAAVPEGTSWEIVDGNLPGIVLYDEIDRRIEQRKYSADRVKIVAMTVMPGPQLVSAVPLARRLKAEHPEVVIVWGGYFPTLYPKPVLAAPYVDFIVRGQGEKTFVELLEVIDGKRGAASVAGLGWKLGDTPMINGERPWLGPDAFPTPPYDRIDVDTYLHPTFLGNRNGVYQASIGCPYSCNFCGVIAAYGSLEKFESPAVTEANLAYLVQHHGLDAVHFYDNNFFLKEPHAEEICERLARLNIRWWCEARIDVMLRYSDRTWEKIARSGLKMAYFGAESGSNERLKRMSKNLTIEQTTALVARIKQYGIVPEFSFVLGDPEDPEDDIETTLAFIRKLKAINPALEVITYFYTPTPQRRGTYGDIDPLESTPETLEEWIEPEWIGWMTHEDPRVPWMAPSLKAKVEDFTLVMKSRFPPLQDSRTAQWGKALGRVLARKRWDRSNFDDPRLLRLVRRLAQRQPDDLQAYGHLRPAPGSGA